MEYNISKIAKLGKINIEFFIGDIVKCIDTTSVNNHHKPNGIHINKKYTVTHISNCICGKELLTLKEAPTLNKYCGENFTGHNSNYYSFRFEKVNENI